MYNNNLQETSNYSIKNITAIKFYKKGIAKKRLNLSAILSYSYKQSTLDDPLKELGSIYKSQKGLFHAPSIMVTSDIYIPEALQKITFLLRNNTNLYSRIDSDT
jgi:hypothetical protein